MTWLIFWLHLLNWQLNAHRTVVVRRSELFRVPTWWCHLLMSPCSYRSRWATRKAPRLGFQVQSRRQRRFLFKSLSAHWWISSLSLRMRLRSFLLSSFFALPYCVSSIVCSKYFRSDPSYCTGSFYWAQSNLFSERNFPISCLQHGQILRYVANFYRHSTGGCIACPISTRSLSVVGCPLWCGCVLAVTNPSNSTSIAVWCARCLRQNLVFLATLVCTSDSLIEGYSTAQLTIYEHIARCSLAKTFNKYASQLGL